MASELADDDDPAAKRPDPFLCTLSHHGVSPDKPANARQSHRPADTSVHYVHQHMLMLTTKRLTRPPQDGGAQRLGRWNHHGKRLKVKAGLEQHPGVFPLVLQSLGFGQPFELQRAATKKSSTTKQQQ